MALTDFCASAMGVCARVLFQSALHPDFLGTSCRQSGPIPNRFPEGGFLCSHPSTVVTWVLVTAVVIYVKVLVVS